MSTTATQQYLTNAQAGVYLNISEEQIRTLLHKRELSYGCLKWRCAGHGDACPGHPGANRLFHIAALDSFIATHDGYLQPLLTTQQVAAFLNVTADTVLSHVSEGRLKRGTSEVRGNRKLFAREAVLEFSRTRRIWTRDTNPGYRFTKNLQEAPHAL